MFTHSTDLEIVLHCVNPSMPKHVHEIKAPLEICEGIFNNKLKPENYIVKYEFQQLIKINI
jgi:hypothetical protein